MDKKNLFYGTPLSRSLENDHTDNDGPINTRKARLNYQQTVRDDQGRQRFHGAFTGGFSAGYFNTVDSVEGFQPRHFVSRRGARREDDDSPKFSHKPEDYMDEEDLGEFGIAPRKIRVTNQYSSNEDSFGRSNHVAESALIDLLKPATLSIGEKILKRINEYESVPKRKNAISERDRLLIGSYPTKNDFHGLGYQTLGGNKATLPPAKCRSVNPLMAILGEGKRLKISGEAFGPGVLEDDEDFLDTNDAYGYDDIGNYEFKSGPTTKSRPKTDFTTNFSDDDRYVQDCDLLPGFILANDLNAMRLCDNIKNSYPLPCIPSDWKMPVRSEPHFALPDTSGIYQKLNLHGRQSSSILNKKFISGSEPIESDKMETRAGLVLYSDLKAIKPNVHEDIESSGVIENITATIIRQNLEWRPCSLLCKHFNVTNPYPSDSFVGVKLSNLIERRDVKQMDVEQLNEGRQELVALEIKRQVFDVIFENQCADNEQMVRDEDATDSDDEPQVVEMCKSTPKNEDEQKSDEEADVVVVVASKPEPEVIVLTSSSSSSSPSPSPSLSKERDDIGCLRKEETDVDTYGPPLPPTLKTLIDLDHRQSTSRNRSSTKQRKKSKKRERSRRDS